MNGYVVDDLALIAGLAGTGSEHHRRELSRLLHGAIDGGPSLDVPALCLSAAALARPAIADHLAELVGNSPSGVINICGFTRTPQLDALRALWPHVGWPATSAAARAIAAGMPVLTLEAKRYSGLGLDVLAM